MSATWNGRVIACKAYAARTGVGRNDRHAQFGSDPVGEGLHGEIFFGAGQVRQPEQQRHLALAGLWRQVNGSLVAYCGSYGSFRGSPRKT